VGLERNKFWQREIELEKPRLGFGFSALSRLSNRREIELEKRERA
jgi:hypothetical protein